MHNTMYNYAKIKIKNTLFLFTLQKNRTNIGEANCKRRENYD